MTWFAYDNAGRLVTSTYPGGAALASSYDADSRITRRLGLLRSDTPTYDATNRVVTGSVYMPGAGYRAIERAYTGLGALNCDVSPDDSQMSIGSRAQGCMPQRPRLPYSGRALMTRLPRGMAALRIVWGGRASAGAAM